uniref:EF-hand domain-containing protein n=1 Tax=Physcomitrium patens TaxID=3218 RepID=A0A7I4CPW6_PHYPA|nr:uncharacterized protein LOC112277602 isoform X1 [Physcomitrium patens]XP_024365908.1 uncharacterized protein LOC112277602 isoform X1 [Physcomitrium patens]|eukprot:XP_024365907.1 uncharacterized protein LOC112277602 isoform X1 [Physcomitrella patens]
MKNSQRREKCPNRRKDNLAAGVLQGCSRSLWFQGFERDREGSLSPVFGLSVSLCPLCGQNRTFTKDGQPPPSNTLKLLGSDGETRTHLSFNDKRWFVVLFPALQPANKDKIELLGEWLRYSMRQNNCEHYDGRFADICSAFILHAIAFLEVVRQVRLQCEERGDMLLHVWRQILRVFTQVIIRVEPKLLAALEETSHLKEIIQSDRKKINQISDELALTTHNLEVTQAQLREKEVQWTQLKRCRFCAGGDDQGRDSRGRKGKHGSGIEGKHGVGASGESAVGDDGSFGFEKSHQRGDEDAEGSGPGGGAETGDAKPRGEHGGTVSAGPGDQGNAGGSIEGVGKREDLNANKHGKISEGYLHPDGLRANVGVQTDPEKTGRSLFFNILKRPVSAPAKMVTAIMEEFALAGGMVKRDRADGEEEQDKKEPEVIGLSAADMAMLEATDDMAEEVEVQTIDKKALKSLAMDSINVLEHVPDDQLEEKMTQTLFNLLGRFRNLKLSTGPDEVDDEDEGEGGSGTKKSRWGKLQRGFEEKKKNTKNFVAVVQELLARQKKPPAKMTKPKDLPNIPLAFSKMMKVNPPPKIVKLFNEHQVVKLVDAVYQKKIEADAVDDLQGNERQTACEFLYDFMLNSYGLKGLAESAVHGVFRRIKQMMVKGIDKCHKLRLFQQFCGFDPLRGYGEPDFYLYLRCLARAQSKVGVLFPSDNEQDTVMNTNPNQADILLEEPALLAQFKDDKDVALDFIEQFSAANGSVEKVSNEVQKLVKAPTVRKVDFDLLMEAIIEVAPHKADFKMPPKKKAATKAAPAITKEESTSLETLFKAGDANQDGVLTFNEFREIIESADSSVSEKQALRMFRETLQVMSGEGDSISPAAFATVAYSNGIRATPAVIFELLKKTWLQKIQDDVNEEKFADDVKEKDYEDMRTELEAMLKEKDPGEVFKTVQIFSDFVIRFCGPMHAAAATEEPAATEEAAAAEERADSDEVKEEREITD